MKSKTNTQNKFSNDWIRTLASSHRDKKLETCIEKITEILAHEGSNSSNTGFSSEEGLYLDRYMQICSRGNRSQTKPSVDIVVVTHKNLVTMIEAKLNATTLQSIKRKDLYDKLLATKGIINDCAYSHVINNKSFVLLSDKNFQQSYSKLRRLLNNDPHIIPWQVSDFLDFVRNNKE